MNQAIMMMRPMNGALFMLLFVLTAPIHEGIHVIIATHVYHANDISVSYPFFGLNPEYPDKKGYLARTTYAPVAIEKEINVFFEEILAHSTQLFTILVMYADISKSKSTISHTGDI